MTHGERSPGVRLCRTAQTWRRAGRYARRVLVLTALAVLTLSLVTVMRRRAAGAEPDLGWVSERWLAEYRADSTRPSL